MSCFSLCTDTMCMEATGLPWVELSTLCFKARSLSGPGAYETILLACEPQECVPFLFSWLILFKFLGKDII